MRIVIISLLLLSSAQSAHVCFPKLFEPFTGNFEEGISTSEPASEEMKLFCPKQIESCCSDELINYFAAGAKYSASNFSVLKLALTQIENRYGKKSYLPSIFTKYPAEAIKKECLPKEGDTPIGVELDLKALEKSFDLNAKLVGSFFCEACSPTFVQNLDRNDDEIKRIIYNTNTLKILVDLIESTFPFIDYYRSKKNHLEAIGCHLGRSSDPSFLKSQEMRDVIKTTRAKLEDKKTPFTLSEESKFLDYLEMIRFPHGVQYELFLEDLQKIPQDDLISEELMVSLTETIYRPFATENTYQQRWSNFHYTNQLIIFENIRAAFEQDSGVDLSANPMNFDALEQRETLLR